MQQAETDRPKQGDRRGRERRRKLYTDTESHRQRETEIGRWRGGDRQTYTDRHAGRQSGR